MEGTSFHKAYTQKGNNTELLAYTALVRLIPENGAVCLDTYREDLVRVLNRLQKREVKFANNINESVWETLAQRRLIARLCALFKAYIERRVWKAIGDRLLKPCYLSRDDHNRRIRSRKQKTDVGKYSFVNMTIKSWNRLLAGLLASFHVNIHVWKEG